MKKRPKQHTMETESRKLLDSYLPSEWIVRRIPEDYGVDLEVEIVDQESVSGNRVWIQLKAIQSADIRKKTFKVEENLREFMPNQSDTIEVEYVAFTINTNDLCYSLTCSFPLLLFVADLGSNKIYWLPIRDEIIGSLIYRNPDWRSQASSTLQMPLWNDLSWEKSQGYPGLRWYALEPARMYSFATIHYYYHEFQYTGRLSGYSIGDGWIDYGEKEELEQSLMLARNYLNAAVEQDVLFGQNGIDHFIDQSKTRDLGIIPIAIQMRQAIKAVDESLKLLETETYEFFQMSFLVSKVGHAINLLSTAISAYQGYRQKYLLTKAGALYRSGTKSYAPPSIPTRRKSPDE